MSQLNCIDANDLPCDKSEVNEVFTTPNQFESTADQLADSICRPTCSTNLLMACESHAACVPNPRGLIGRAELGLDNRLLQHVLTSISTGRT